MVFFISWSEIKQIDKTFIIVYYLTVIKRLKQCLLDEQYMLEAGTLIQVMFISE